MKHDAIIFDIDGTLWNACPTTAKGWAAGFKHLGVNTRVTSKQVESVAGKPFEQCLEILFPKLLKQIPVLSKTLSSFEMKALQENGGKMYNGAFKAIKELSKKYKIFLVSNCQTWYLDLFIKFSEIKPYLSGFNCNGLSGQAKDKMLINIKAKYSLINPVYIGDTQDDQDAASRARVDFIFASWGFGTLKNKAVSINSFKGLLEYIKKEK